MTLLELLGQVDLSDGAASILTLALTGGVYKGRQIYYRRKYGANGNGKGNPHNGRRDSDAKLCAIADALEHLIVVGRGAWYLQLETYRLTYAELVRGGADTTTVKKPEEFRLPDRP